MELEQRIREYIKEIESSVIEIRRDIHQYPELGFEEERTAGRIKTVLTDLGYQVTDGIARTGITAVLPGKKEGPVIALRADMDALPITEKNDLSYASKAVGKMHACGHDAHVAVLLGAAMAFAQFKEELPGQIKLIFQPAEEGPGGARPMIEQGVLTGPDVDYILGLHVWLDLEAGKIGFKSGPTFASIDEFDLVVKGSSAHGAEPHQGLDAILVASRMIESFQTVISREIDPLEPAVITVGRIEGGYRRNVIADRVALEGTVRCINPRIRVKLEERIKQIISGISTIYGTGYELDYRHVYPPLINDEKVTEELRLTAEEVIGRDNVVGVEKPTLGGEDFAFFLEEVPGTFFFLGGRNEEKGIKAPHHNPFFNIDEEVLATGVEIMVKTALRLLNNDV